MEFITSILQVVIGLLIFYFIVNRITGRSSKGFNKKFSKYFLILLSTAVLMHIVINYLAMAQPDVITQTIEQLKANPDIKRTIGEQNGYTFNTFQIDSIESYPAVIDVTLNGTKADIDLSVTIDSSDNIFKVRDYKIEQLLEK